MNNMNYEQDMYIDEDALDLECLEQATLMIKYSTKLADLKKERDLKKEEMDLVKAELDKEIRGNPESFDIVKITETVVTNTIIAQEKYKDIMKKYLTAKYEVDVATGVVSAVEQRKSMIEALIKLHGQQYFAGPNIPRNIEEERKLKQEKGNKKKGEMIRKKNN